MYIIMYKYSAFRINHKSFRSSMSKNFTVIPGSDRGSHSEQERHHPLPALNVTVMLHIRRWKVKMERYLPDSASKAAAV